MKLNLNENNFSIKLEIDMKVFNDNEIAIFDFSINNVVKKIILLQKIQKIKNIGLNIIKKVENKKLLEIHNLNDIDKGSFLISPFTCWGKGIFLFRECYINGKKDLELEVPQNSTLYYLSNEGYLEKNKDDNYLIIIQMKENWYSTIGFGNFISITTFQHILMTKINNFYDDFSKYFPNECKKLSGNMFEYLSKLLLDKAKGLIKDKEYAFNLIKNNEDMLHLNNNIYYYFNKDNYIFNNSKTLETLINAIKDNETEFYLNNDNNNDNIIKINDDINNSDSDSENEKEIINNLEDNQIKYKKEDNKFLIHNGIPIKDVNRKDLIQGYDFGKSEINEIEISEINFIQIPKIITINSLIKFYDDCDLGTIVFPLYIFKAKQSKNEEEQKKISDYSFIVSTNGLELMPKLKKENKFKILLCACKSYKKEQKNGILLVVINMEENIDIKNTFCDTENFEVYCFCPLLYNKD
jgi:hypothetical protein